VGAVHALSYPLGGTYHVPHGEANYQFLTAVFKCYQDKQPVGVIQELNDMLAGILLTKPSEVYERLELLFGNLLSKNKLSSYGMTPGEIESFADAVVEKQGRLLANNYVAFSRDEIRNIYQSLF